MSFLSPEMQSRQQTEALMQPALIRVIDHVRAALEQSDWSGQYETVHAWPGDVSPAVQTEVLWLLDQLETVDEFSQTEIERQLADLPQPIAVYLLHLTQGDRKTTMNLWELCYQICLTHYVPQLNRTTVVEIPIDAMQPDLTLFDEAGDVDWGHLDQKTAQVVQAAFQQIHAL